MTCTFDARKLAHYSILAFSDVFSYCVFLIESGTQNTMESVTVCSNIGSTLKFADSCLIAIYNMVVKEYYILEDIY